MTNISLSTPALLFPAISLLLLAYTNRFLTLASVLRAFSEADMSNERTLLQIDNFKKRIGLIKQMQAFGALSFFLCVICMFVLHMGYTQAGSIIFAFSLILLAWSLVQSVREIHISAEALNIHLEDIQRDCSEKQKVKPK